jgi:hypothetical protein
MFFNKRRQKAHTFSETHHTSKREGTMDLPVSRVAVLLNSKGIEALDCRDYDLAAQEFARSLSLVKKAIAECEEEMQVEDFVSAGVQTPCFFERQAEETQDCDISKDFHMGNYVFRNPMIVGAPEDSCFSTLTLLSLPILYNLALAHHLKALSSNNCAESLRRAHFLYELVLSLNESEGIEFNIIQTMAIVNNLGQVHRTLGSQDRAQLCFQHLLSTIMFVNDMHVGHELNLEGFIANVVPLILPESKCASAA